MAEIGRWLDRKARARLESPYTVYLKKGERIIKRVQHKAESFANVDEQRVRIKYSH